MSNPEVRDRLEAVSRSVIPQDLTLESLGKRREQLRRRERLTAGGVGVVLTLALITGGVLAIRGNATRSHVNTNGGSLPAVHAPGLQDGQYMYRRMIGVGVAGQSISTTWWATDDSGRAEFQCTIPHSNCGGGPEGTFGPGQFLTDSGDLSYLSTDPDVLLAQLETRTAPGGRSPEPAASGSELTAGVTAESLWVAVQNLMAEPNGGPALKAALFEVAATVPGMTVETSVTDPVGRPATALVLGDASSNAPLTIEYFDPSSGQLMAYGVSPGVSGGPFGYGVLEAGIVDSTSAAPAGDQWLFPPISRPLPSPSARP